jgi:tetratricopeptide (TPR) repeat protein
MPVLAAAALLAAPSSALQQRYKVENETPGGQLLQQATLESDEAKRLAIYEQFLEKFPQHEGMIYALTQIQPLLLNAGQLDRAIAAGEKILAAEPENAPAGYNALQACEKKADAACIITWAGRTVDASKKALAVKKPDDAGEAESWERQQDFAKQVGLRCEYSLFAGALQARTGGDVASLCEALEKMNPASQYFAQVGGRCLGALAQVGPADKPGAFADRLAAAGNTSDEILVFAAEANLSGGKDLDKAIGYAGALTKTLPTAAAPQGISPADWEARKKAVLGRAWWILGAAQSGKQQWAESEASMKQCLSMIEGTPAAKDLTPGAYFYLGVAVHAQAKAGPKTDAARLAEAKKHFTTCAASDGPFKEMAQKNLKAMAAGK